MSRKSDRPHRNVWVSDGREQNHEEEDAEPSAGRSAGRSWRPIRSRKGEEEYHRVVQEIDDLG